MRKIADALSQKPNSSYTKPREQYLVLRSKRGILEAERNPEQKPANVARAGQGKKWHCQIRTLRERPSQRD